MVDRLDDGRIEDLRTWGSRLEADGREELRAAGKAIVMLIDEIDRLRVHRRQPTEPEGLARIGDSYPVDEAAAVEPASSQSLGASLRERLGVAIPGRSAYGRDSDS